MKPKLVGKCDIEGCDTPKQRRQWCKKHYKRWLLYGDAEQVQFKAYLRKPTYLYAQCAVSGCISLASARGYCDTHYARWRTTGSVTKNPLSQRHQYPAEYKVWIGLRERCRNVNATSYRNYGGRGITVCDRWDVFENFLADMGKRPTARHSIERINNDGNYEPSNCKWATYQEQAQNTQRVRRIEFGGHIKTIRQWCDCLGVPLACVKDRIDRKWSFIDAVTHGYWHSPNRV